MSRVRPILLTLPLLLLAPGCGNGGNGGDGGDGKGDAPKQQADVTAADAAIETIDAFIAEKRAAGVLDTTRPTWKTTLPKPPMLKFDPNRTYLWDVKTNKGDFTIRFMPEVAPYHVSSAIYLTRLGFYDGLTFHRVIQQFMAQGGDPLGNGMGSPGYRFDGEFSPSVRHDRPYLLSMANAGPGTDGSQFFITFAPTPQLDGKHTIYGEVVEGTQTIETLESFGAPWNRDGPPRVRLQIESAKVRVLE